MNPVEQVRLARNVAVERHRLYAELLPEPAHAERVHSFAIDHGDRRAEDAISREWLAARGSSGLGHGVTLTV